MSVGGLVQWILVDADDRHPKHTTGWAHPIFTFLVGILCSPCLGYYGADRLSHFSSTSISHGESLNDIFLGIFLILYQFVTVVARVGTLGYSVLYEQLWACNVAQSLAAVGIITSRPTMVGAACLAVAIDQICWYVDILSRVFMGKYIIGVAKYLDWPETTTVTRATSFHHLWFLPVCLWHLRCVGGMPSSSFLLSSFGVCIMSVMSRLLVPFKIKKGNSLKKTDELVYSNVNMTHEFWKDIPVDLLHRMDGKPWYFYLPYLMIVYNILHWPFFIAMQALTLL